MITDLFSSLDGAYKISLWLPSLIILTFFISQNRIRTLLSIITSSRASIWKEGALLRYNPFKLLLTTLFILLLLTNFLGLTPYSYSLSRDLFTIRALATLFWSLLLVSGWFKAPIESAAHLVPQGAPLGLAPFLVLIETVRILIRPLTLTVRLMANISAGHIVLGLLANRLSALVGSLAMFLTLILRVSYIIFEFFVCVIQAYIFSLLIRLYQTEHP